MKNPQYLAVYRDTGQGRVKYYGPFVSQHVAETFLDTLPKPQMGGVKTWKIISPYQHDEADEAALAILSERLGQSPIDTILNNSKQSVDRLLRRA